jgi:hypothetical protein
MEPAWEQKLLWLELTPFDPLSDGFARSLRDLELYGPLGLLLHDDGASRDSPAVCHVAYPHQVARPELAVDGKVKYGEVANAVGDLQPDADSPNVLELQGQFLPYQLALIPRFVAAACCERRFHDSAPFWLKGAKACIRERRSRRSS